MRLDGAGTRSKFGAPMFEPEMYCRLLKKVLVTLLGHFGALAVILRPHSDSAPRELCLHCPPSLCPGVDIKTLNVHEDLVSLYETGCTKSQAITKNIKDAICRLGLDLNGCRGQRCDGASNMWRRVSGVQAWTTSEYLKAIFYSLLLSFFELGILCSKEILMMRNALDTIQQ